MAPFALPPRKSSACPTQTDEATAKRRVHRYENVPVEAGRAEAPKQQDLFGLVPFSALKPGQTQEVDVPGEQIGQEAGVNNLSFEDIGPEETEWNV